MKMHIVSLMKLVGIMDAYHFYLTCVDFGLVFLLNFRVNFRNPSELWVLALCTPSYENFKAPSQL